MDLKAIGAQLTYRMVIHDAVGAARGDVDALPLRGPVLGEVQRDDWLALVVEQKTD